MNSTTTVPMHLTAAKIDGDPIWQHMENQRIERYAIEDAKRDSIGVHFLPLWIVDGQDVSEEMIAWPDGSVCTLVEYQNEEAHRNAVKYWAAGSPSANAAEDHSDELPAPEAVEPHGMNLCTCEPIDCPAFPF